jgi:hypothetical protein
MTKEEQFQLHTRISKLIITANAVLNSMADFNSKVSTSEIDDTLTNTKEIEYALNDCNIAIDEAYDHIQNAISAFEF